jgi:endonuclease-3
MTGRRPEDFPWDRFLDRLASYYGTGDWRVPYLRSHHEDPFRVLIGTILSQRTRDENTDRAAALLFARYPDARSLARAPLDAVERLIHGTGFYKAKARNIRACAQALLARFAGAVPRDFASLLELPGVGPKTANCVLVFGYAIPALPVDTHVHRIANRLAVVRTRTPEATEARLREVVPERYWLPLNPMLVQHGQNLCRPRNPLCPRCPVLELCATGRARRDGRATPRPEDATKAKPRARTRVPSTRRRATSATRTLRRLSRRSPAEVAA